MIADEDHYETVEAAFKTWLDHHGAGQVWGYYTREWRPMARRWANAWRTVDSQTLFKFETNNLIESFHKTLKYVRKCVCSRGSRC